MMGKEFSKNFASASGSGEEDMPEAGVSKPLDGRMQDVHMLCLDCVELGFKNLGLGFLKAFKTSEVQILGFYV